MNVDADSGEGHILLRVNRLGVGTPRRQVTKVITVSKAGLVGSLEIKTDSASDNTIGSSGLHRTSPSRSRTPRVASWRS